MSLFNLREIFFDAETTFCENESTPAALTYTYRIPVISASFSPSHDRIDRPIELSRRDDMLPGVLGPKTGTLEITTYIPGHGAAPTGALTKTWFALMLEKAFGGCDVASIGTTAATGTLTVTEFTVAAKTGWASGQIGRVGVKADGTGDGMAFVAGTPGSTSLLSQTALPAAPVNGTVVYACQTVYPAPGSEASVRFCVGWTPSGAQYHALGCQLESITFSMDHGTVPQATLRYQVANWARYAVTVPSATPALSANVPGPVMGGSIYLSANSTRAVIAADKLSFRIETGLSVERYPVAGQSGNRVIAGYQRLRTTPFVEITKAWATGDEAYYDTDGDSTPSYLCLVTLNAVAGRSIGFYCPQLQCISPRPSTVDVESRLDHTLTFRGRELTTGTNDLQKSSWRFFMG